jgi:apolipoprotein N-acyltransferase
VPSWRDGLALLSGLLLFLSFPKFGHGAVAWIALAPLLMAIPGTRGRESARLGYVTGATSAVGVLYWTALVVMQFGGLSLPMGLTVMMLLCLTVALFPALFGWAVGRLCATFGRAGLFLAPAVWVATEILRAYTMFRFPWCLLGYSQYQNLPMIQLASATGVYGVSFLVALSSAALAFAVGERNPRRRYAALGGLALTLLAVWAHGAWTMSQPPVESGRVRAGLVQASILQDDKWDPERALENIERHVELSHEAAAQGARLLVWPESAVPFHFDQSPATARELRALVAKTGAALVFGNDDLERSPDGVRVWVGAKMLRPDGDLVYRYHKVRLVPFGEYVPMKAIITVGGRFAARLVRGVADFTPGEEASVGAFEGHLLGTSICYEAIFADYIRRFSGNGAELLLNITNDGWYGTTSAPPQHFAMAAFRAVENHKWLLRAANTGISAFIDPHGRIVARTQLFERRVLVGEAAFVPGLTLYARFGDVFGFTCLGLTVLALVTTFRRRPALPAAPSSPSE